MSAVKTYEIKVYRDGKWWMVEIPEIDGLTQARRLSEVEDMARSYIAVDQDVAPSEIQLRNPQVIVSGEDLRATMRDIFKFRKAARLAEEKAAALMVETARRLADRQVPLRDIGEVLGVSHQRVHQLVQEINEKAGKAIESYNAQVESLNARNRQAIKAMSGQTERARRKVDRSSVVYRRVVAKKAAQPPAKKAAEAAPAKKAAEGAPAKKAAEAAPAKKAAARRRLEEGGCYGVRPRRGSSREEGAAAAKKAPARRTRSG